MRLVAQQARITLPESRSALPDGAVDLGAAPPSQPTQELLLHLHGAATDDELNALLKDLNDPASPDYHHWLTPAAFSARFGASDDQVAAAKAWAQAQGFTVDAVNTAHTYLAVSGNVAQAQRAFSVPLHQYQVGSVLHIANTEVASLPEEAAGLITGVEGLSDVSAVSAAALAPSGTFQSLDSPDFSSLAALVDQNAISALYLKGAPDAWKPLLQQANAQGITVLTDTPFFQSQATVIASAPGDGSAISDVIRPDWQNAPGLPADGLRAAPDFVSAQYFSTTLARLIQKNGGPLGNINPILYRLAPIPGVFTQADGAPAGTWEAGTGLGVVNAEELIKVWPFGSSPTNTSITSSNFAPTHGLSFTLTATVTAQSGGGIPSGTVTFASSATGTLGTGTLDANGKATFSTDQLAGGTYSFNATYNGDATYNTSTTPVPATVNVQAESASISAILNGTATYGSNATVTVTVTGSSTVGYPAGTVKAQGQGTTDTTAYSATLAPSGTPGKSTANITYPVSEKNTFSLLVSCTSADNNFTCFTPYTLSVTPGATKTASTTTLASAPNPPVAGSSATFTATVASGSSSITTTPTGTITFQDNGATIGSGTLSGGTASFTTTLAAGSVHTITAAYSGDSVYNNSTSSAISTAAGSTVSTVALSSSPNPPVLGANATFTATVASGSTSSIASPTGTVIFKDNATTLSTAPLTAGVATYTGVLATGSAHSITAAYTGDTTYAASTSAPIVVGTPTSGTLTASLSPATVGYGSKVSITAGVAATSGTVNGTVQAVISGQTYTGTITAGTGTISFDAPKPGTYTIAVSCPATTTFTCTNSVSLTLYVIKGATATTLVSSQSSLKAGEKTTLTATIANSGNGTGPYTYSGTVTFLDGNQSIGSATVVGDTATASVALTGARTHSITAVYSGDANWFGSTSTAIPVVTTQIDTNLVLTASSTSPLAGANVVLTATVTAGTATSLAPATGTVTFYDTVGTSVLTLGSAPLVANGPSASVALFSTTGLQAGAHRLYAVYVGDTNYKTSTSNTLLLSVSDFAVTFNPTILSIKQGGNGQAAITVTNTSGFSGSITFGCTPAPDTLMGCSFNPAVLQNGGTTVLTVTTTANTAKVAGWRLPAGSAVLAVLMAWLLPTRRKLRALLVLLYGVFVIGISGCGSGVLDSGSGGGAPGGSANNGTPLGTQLVTVTAAATDGATPVRHTYTLQVNVQ